MRYDESASAGAALALDWRGWVMRSYVTNAEGTTARMDMLPRKRPQSSTYFKISGKTKLQDLGPVQLVVAAKSNW